MKKKWLLIILVLLTAAIIAAVVFACAPEKTGGVTLTLSQKTLQMDALEKAELVATVKDSNGKVIEKPVTWSSDNEAVVKVENGTLTALTAGKATVTAQAEGKQAQCEVTVSAVVRPMMVFAKTEYEVGKGTTNQIVPTIRFKSQTLDADEYGITYSFSCENTDIATVNAKGVITGVAVGQTEVIVTANFPMAAAAGLDGELVARVKVCVVPDYTLSIELAEGDTADIYLQEAVVEEVTCKEKLSLVVLEGLYEDQDITAEVTFCSSDDTIAVVSDEGVVTLASDAQEGDEVDVWACYVTPNEGEVNSNRITLTVRKAVVEKEIKGDLIIDLSAGGKINSYAVFGKNAKIVDVYDSEDAYKNSLWDSEKNRIDPEFVETLGERSLVIVGEKVSYQVNALVVTQTIRTAQQFANIFFRSDKLQNIKADGYYILGNNIDCSEIAYKGRGWNATDGYGLVGTFDGRGYTMDNLTMPYGGGIFGVISSKATLKNVAFTNVKMLSNGHSVILGYGVYGTVENVYVGITELGTTLDSANASIGLCFQTNAANVLNNVVVMCSTRIDHPAKTNKYGILEGGTNKGAWDNTFVIGADRLFGGDGTAGNTGTANAKFVQKFNSLSALKSSQAYADRKKNFPTDIWDLSTMTFKSSRQYFRDELNQLPESLEISVNKEEPLLTNYAAFNVSVNNKKLKIKDGVLTATGDIAGKDKAKITVSWGGIKKVITVKTRQEMTADITYNMNQADQGDLVITGIPVNQATVKVYFPGLDGNEIELNGTCEGGKLVIAAADIAKVENSVASGDQSLRIDYGAEDSYYVNGVKLAWVVHNANELLKMREHMVLTENTYYGMIALGADIDLSNVTISNTGMAGKIFSGIFDGRYHKVSNLTAQSPNVGLLGDVSGTVKNLRVENATVSTNTAAVIGGALSGTAENIYVSGSITGDGMSANSNLSNFGNGLLAGRIEKTAIINNVIVEVQSMASGLRLGTAFGKLHAGAPETVFTNCYAVNASGKAYMYGNNGVFTKKNFSTASTNANFADMAALWENAKAAALAQSLGLTAPLKGLYTDLVYYMNDGPAAELTVSGLNLDIPSVKVYLVALDGTEVELDASCAGGELVISAASMEAAFGQIATGQHPIRIAVGDQSEYVLGAWFVWVINNADELLKMREHLTLEGTTYDGMLALGADIDLTGVKIANTGMAGKKFAGVFDGRSHTLSNLNANSPNVGLLGDVSGTVKNLRVENATVSTNTAAVIGGGLSGTASNIYVSGCITGDGMSATSNLSNFGCGLLAGRIEKGADINNVIVEVLSITDGLRLGTAFGKLHGGAPESVFTNCYAVGAADRAFMVYQDPTWTAKAFNETDGRGNKNFATMQALGASADTAVQTLIETMGLNCTELGHRYEMGVWYWSEDCTQAQLEVTCGRCGNVSTHTADVTKGQGSVDATCTAPGQANYVATAEVDGVQYSDTRSAILPQMVHTVTHMPAQEATCMATGNTEYWYCPGCLTYYTDAEGTNTTTLEAVTLPTTDHTYEQMVATDDYLKAAGSETARAQYYKSCICGTAGTEVFYGSYGGNMDVNNGQNLVIEHDVFTGSGNATVTIGSVSLKAIYANGKLIITDSALKAASTLPTGQVTMVVTYGEKSVTIEGISLTWVINNWDQMAVMEKHLVVSGSSYTGSLALGADFSMSGKSIGNWLWKDSGVYTFNGTFDGRNHTISDVNANSPLKGLFKSVGPDGVVKNLKITNATVSTYTAAVVGFQLYGTLENIYVQGSITADGMGTASNLGNFGSGLLAAQICKGAKISGCIVELTDMADGLRLATAFGKLHQPETLEADVFTNCYAVNADSCTFMPYSETKEGWTKVSFTEDTENLNFATMKDLWLNEAAAALAKALELEEPVQGAVSIVLENGFDMNAGKDLVVENAAFTGNHSGSVTVSGTAITLANAVIADGKLTVPAASFVQDTMPSGQLTLVAQFGDTPVEITGEFTWVINDWAGLAYMEKHMVVSGTNYVGSLALGADIDATGKNIANFLWKDTAVYTFIGSFDGRNHTISNLTANTPLKGLFKSVGADGVVKNLRVINATVSTYTAAVVGYQLYGTLENVYVQGSITADGMGTSSNLANFGCGLLAAQICNGAKINDTIVELSSIKDGLRLATAFGKIHQANTTEASVFNNCYAVGAEGCSFMQYSTWAKQSFTTSSANKTFTDMAALWADASAAALAAALGLTQN